MSEEANADVRMFIPPKVLADGLRIRGDDEVPTASGVDAGFLPDTE
jgi:hypothetical protein